MSENALFSPADAKRIEQQSRELVGRWPKIQVLPGQLSVVADYASPYARKVWDRLQLILLAGLVALAGYLAWKTPVLDSYANLAYPHVVGYARSATEAIILAYLVPAGGLVILGTVIILVSSRVFSHQRLHVAFMPEAICVQRRFRGFDRYPRSTRMTFEMRPHERAKDEESWEQRELRQSKTSWTGRYYRKAFHVALRLGDYRRIDLADVYGERKAEALHNALNFAGDAVQRLSRQPKPPERHDHPVPDKSYGPRPAV